METHDELDTIRESIITTQEALLALAEQLEHTRVLYHTQMSILSNRVAQLEKASNYLMAGR